MADKAHILIADISGFTDFNATTEITTRPTSLPSCSR
jgi:hypothetical protein